MLSASSCSAFTTPQLLQRTPDQEPKHSTTNGIISINKRASFTNKLTIQLVDIYANVNPKFRLMEKLPQRILTNPSIPASNNNLDNIEANLICRVNDRLEAPHCTFIILDLLGTGTFGQVFRCLKEDTSGSRELCAVKVVKNKPAYYSQGQLEIKIATYLNTKDPRDERHIVRLQDSFEFQGHVCLVFELLSMSLLDILTQNQFRGLPLAVVQRFTQQILSALVVLEDAKIIHCDLKPENILLCPPKLSKDTKKDGASASGDEAENPAENTETRRKLGMSSEVKLIDFGSACFEGRTMYAYIQSRFYRSPEVLIGLPYSGAIDLWSLGCVCAEMYLGLPIFPGVSQHNQLSRIIEMLGAPPDSFVERGKNGGKYFCRVGPVKKATTFAHAADSLNGANKAASAAETLRNSTPIAIQSLYRLKSAEEYAAETDSEVPVLRKYLRYSRLEDVILNCPLANKSKLSNAQKADEIRHRRCFLDFLLGLLRLDPAERWTSKQAASHPFITNAPFTGAYFAPPIQQQQQHQDAPGGSDSGTINRSAADPQTPLSSSLLATITEHGPTGSLTPQKAVAAAAVGVAVNNKGYPATQQQQQQASRGGNGGGSGPKSTPPRRKSMPYNYGSYPNNNSMGGSVPSAEQFLSASHLQQPHHHHQQSTPYILPPPALTQQSVRPPQVVAYSYGYGNNAHGSQVHAHLNPNLEYTQQQQHHHQQLYQQHLQQLQQQQYMHQHSNIAAYDYSSRSGNNNNNASVLPPPPSMHTMGYSSGQQGVDGMGYSYTSTGSYNGGPGPVYHIGGSLQYQPYFFTDFGQALIRPDMNEHRRMMSQQEEALYWQQQQQQQHLHQQHPQHSPAMFSGPLSPAYASPQFQNNSYSNTIYPNSLTREGGQQPARARHGSFGSMGMYVGHGYEVAGGKERNPRFSNNSATQDNVAELALRLDGAFEGIKGYSSKVTFAENTKSSGKGGSSLRGSRDQTMPAPLREDERSADWDPFFAADDLDMSLHESLHDNSMHGGDLRHRGHEREYNENDNDGDGGAGGDGEDVDAEDHEKDSGGEESGEDDFVSSRRKRAVGAESRDVGGSSTHSAHSERSLPKNYLLMQHTKFMQQQRNLDPEN